MTVLFLQISVTLFKFEISQMKFESLLKSPKLKMKSTGQTMQQLCPSIQRTSFKERLTARTASTVLQNTMVRGTVPWPRMTSCSTCILSRPLVSTNTCFRLRRRWGGRETDPPLRGSLPVCISKACPMGFLIPETGRDASAILRRPSDFKSSESKLPTRQWVGVPHG